MACSTFWCGSVETPIWNVTREMPPRTSFTYRIFFATVFASPISSAPVREAVGHRAASGIERYSGARAHVTVYLGGKCRNAK
jgi:hypothetical protein